MRPYPKKTYFLLATLSFVCLLTACKEKKVHVEKEMSLVVKEEKKAEKLYFSGELKPLKETAISVPSDSKVKKMMFSFGGDVKKGQALIELDSPEQQKEYDEALTSYLKAKDDLDVAVAKFAGTKSLWKEKLVSENMFKSDKSALFTSKISFYQAKSKLLALAKKMQDISTSEMLALSLSDFDRVQEVLNKHKNKIILNSPIDGIALLPPKSEDNHGLRVGSSIKAAEVITLIGDVSGLSIVIKIPEINIDKITEGMAAEVTGIAFPDIVLNAVVKSINAQANTNAGDAGGLPIFTAKVIVPELKKEQRNILKIGMSASVNVILKEQNRMMVPIKSVHLEGEKAWVSRKKQNGNTEKVFVETGLSTESAVQIVSGLKTGDTITWKE